MTENKYIPKWIAWEITGKCNLTCVHCRCSADMQTDQGIWTLDKAKDFMDDLSGYSKPVIVLTGGEPLLRKDIFDIASYGTDKGFRMCIATNGTLVNDDICLKMKDSGIRP